LLDLVHDYKLSTPHGALGTSNSSRDSKKLLSFQLHTVH